MNETIADRTLLAYEEYERRFIEFLTVVPYVSGNENVWSPVLLDLLLGVCGLLDSMFRQISPDPYTPPVGKAIQRRRLKISHYREQFASTLRLSCARTLVLITPPEMRRPFRAWDRSINKNPHWWMHHNEVKHDRLNNMHLATADATLEALCGMFTAAASYPRMYPILLRRGWTHAAGFNPAYLIENLSTSRRWQSSPSGSSGSFVAYTSLFVTSLGPTLLPDRPEDINPADFLPVDGIMAFLGKGL